MSRSSPFLTAQWRHLVMLNFEIDPRLLQPRVPSGTELDFWNGKTFVSLVGFRFLETRLRGWRIPFHSRFDEVNLRFYVRYKSGGKWRRAVVFLKEVAPRSAVVLVARWIYNEQYVRVPMRSVIDLPSPANNLRGSVSYHWRWARGWNELSAQIAGQAEPPRSGSQEEFIAEHYWGCSAQRDGSTLEYQVQHPLWRIWPARQCRFQGNVASLYGQDFATVVSGAPSSGFVADGSSVAVYPGSPLCVSRDEQNYQVPCEQLLTQPNTMLAEASRGAIVVDSPRSLLNEAPADRHLDLLHAESLDTR